MIPKDLFMEMIDADARLTIGTPWMTGDERLEVSRMTKGKITLRRGTDKIAGDANALLARLNWLLASKGTSWRSKLVGVKFDERDYVPSLDPGSGTTVEILVTARNTNKGGAPRTITLRVEQLYTNRHDDSICEVTCDGRRSLHTMYMDDMGNLHELDRHSVRSIPKRLHAKIAGSGSSRYAESFRALYGGAALREAERAEDAAHDRFIADLTAIRNGTAQRSA